MIWTLAAAAQSTAEQHIDMAVQNAQHTIAGALQGNPAAISAVLQQYILPLVWAIVILVLAWLIAAAANRFMRRSLHRAHMEETLARFCGKLAFYTIVTLGIVFALSKFGINVTSFAALLAAVGFAIGIAVSGSLSNIAAGVMLMIFRPFKVGQFVHAAGVSGTVDEIELFSTTLDTADNRRIIIPNSKIFGDIIENDSHHPERRLDVSVGVGYAADLDRTRQVLEQVVASITEVVPGENRGLQVVLTSLGDSAVNWTLRLWVRASDYWRVKEKLTGAIKMRLDEAGIDIPYPQMAVHLPRGTAEDLRALMGDPRVARAQIATS